MEDYLRPGERLDDLQAEGYRIIQRPDRFCFGIDAVLLAWFAHPDPKAPIVEFCAGTGAVTLLCAAHTAAGRLIALELQEEIADMTRRSVALNGLEGRIQVVCGDLCHVGEILGKNFAGSVLCNPPYCKVGSGQESLPESVRIARHEVRCTLEGVIDAAWDALYTEGRLFLIHQAARLDDIFVALEARRFAPKRVCMVQPREGQAPNLVLVEAVKCGKKGLSFLPPVIVYGPDGQYSAQMLDIYARRGQGE